MVTGGSADMQRHRHAGADIHPSGISLGIGQLSNSSLTPDSIDMVIASLTDDFSMAFLTSVIGLPLSAILRTFLIVLNASLAFGSTPSTRPASGGDRPVTTLSLS